MGAIIQVIEDSSFSVDISKSVLAISIDFSKAFDLVDPELLLEKLLKLELPTWLVSWIASYLINRKQRVVINGSTSEWKSVDAGVIQGSILGPILFILFISDINEVFQAGVVIQKYADDILVYILDYSLSNSQLPQEIVNAVDNCCFNKIKWSSTQKYARLGPTLEESPG